MTMNELNALDSELRLSSARIPHCQICGVKTPELTPARFNSEWDLCDDCWHLHGGHEGPDTQRSIR